MAAQRRPQRRGVEGRRSGGRRAVCAEAMRPALGRVVKTFSMDPGAEEG